jgi:biotin operon repressor
MKQCVNCSRKLTKDETALSKKMLGKNTKQFLCLDCLSEYLNTDKDILIEKIEQFKEEGCTLFT